MRERTTRLRAQDQLRAVEAEEDAIDAELHSTLADIARLEEVAVEDGEEGGGRCRSLGQAQPPGPPPQHQRITQQLPCDPVDTSEYGTTQARAGLEPEPEQLLLTKMPVTGADSDSEDMRAVIIDNGISTIKVGFSGGDAPLSSFPAVVGHTKHGYLPVGADPLYHKYVFVGDEAYKKRGILLLQHPVDSLGLVTRWDDMEIIWQHAFFNEARVAPEESPVLMTEAILTPKANRERMIQICFETFEVPFFFVCTRAALALFGTSRATGIVLQVSDGEPYAIPFYQGNAIVHSVVAIRCMRGCELDDLMSRLLSERGCALCDTAAEGRSTLAPATTVGLFGMIRQQLSYVALDLEAEMRKPERSTTALEKSRQLLEFSKLTHARLCGVGAIGDIETDICLAVAEIVRHDVSAWFRLPPEEGGLSVRVGSERFRCAEALFDPLLLRGEGYAAQLDHADHLRGTAFHGGVHELVYNSVRSCDAGLRRELLRHVVCQGGHTRMPGFAERLQLELARLVAERGLGGSEALRHPRTLMRAVDADAPITAGSRRRPEAKTFTAGSQPEVVVVVDAGQHAAWLGGSAISVTPSLQWISRAQYEEEGPTLVHRYC
eukprot:COSAG01_NODE_1096_length_11713_cov_213.007060_10_plen_606_part_00